MAGTQTGGEQAAITNKQKYGPDFYTRIGAVGGRRSRTGGFAAGEEGRRRARIFGALGGSMSSRGTRALTADERQQKRQAFEKKYEKTLARLNRIHAEAMKEKHR